MCYYCFMANKSMDEPATKRDVIEIVGDAIDKVLKGMDKMFKAQNKRIEKIETDVTFIKRDVQDIKVDISTTPTREEHEKLKAKVEKYHPLS